MDGSGVEVFVGWEVEWAGWRGAWDCDVEGVALGEVSGRFDKVIRLGWDALIE